MNNECAQCHGVDRLSAIRRAWGPGEVNPVNIELDQLAAKALGQIGQLSVIRIGAVDPNLEYSLRHHHAPLSVGDLPPRYPRTGASSTHRLRIRTATRAPR